MEVPKSIHDRNVLHGIFDEVLVLDKFKDDSRISHAYDFGTDDDYYWITMKNYKCSLKFWLDFIIYFFSVFYINHVCFYFSTKLGDKNKQLH